MFNLQRQISVFQIQISVNEGIKKSSPSWKKLILISSGFNADHSNVILLSQIFVRILMCASCYCICVACLNIIFFN